MALKLGGLSQKDHIKCCKWLERHGTYLQHFKMSWKMLKSFGPNIQVNPCLEDICLHIALLGIKRAPPLSAENLAVTKLRWPLSEWPKNQV